MKRTAEFNLDVAQKILVNTHELQSLLSCGYATAVRIGTDAQARVKVGKRVLWNRRKIEAYISDIAD